MNDILKEYEWLEALEKCRISIHDNIKEPPPVIQVDNLSQWPVTIMTKGNISVVKGQAKSRKTFAITMLVADVIQLVRKSKFTSPRRMKVAYFDTEQSAFYAKKIVDRIKHIAGEEMTNDGFFCYCLRNMNSLQRKKMIDIAFQEFKDFDIFVVDGVRDLMKDINNQEESTDLVNDLMKWTAESGIHLITVLHENPSLEGGGKLRGHIGTELMNKAETVLEVMKVKDSPQYSVIKPYMVRGMDFDPIYFTIEDGVPVVDKYYDEFKPVADAPY
jgi:hypothetical protein